MALLSDEEVSERLTGLEGWERKGDSIAKTYENGDFVGSVEFVKRLVEPAEDMGHHPDLEVSWDKVTVSITRVKGRKVDAVLEFVHPPTDHSGSYHLSGTYDPGKRRIAFRAGKWIKIDVHDHDRTEEFVAVGMDGRVDADGDTFSGRMTASPCTTVHLHAR